MVKYLRPVLEGLVAGHDPRTALIALADDLEEAIGALSIGSYPNLSTINRAGFSKRAISIFMTPVAWASDRVLTISSAVLISSASPRDQFRQDTAFQRLG